ncbi:hypothetical protein LOY64_05715 [Pseudomonas corrugata]|jgi:hypothetical protein|uniref:Uncharacterized protein n=1 Tax=Pseudomonas corrugata TaxID=47879 RepID=A0A8B6UTX6_9PSED|nr:hypothetical protein [Pseudomonas corrugata]AOE64060.1 hypothetical protein AXG94_20630 [Pseudomonas corrugata]MDU9026147.1 hypothetical protein [Pseudomonas corrugata]MDU9033999.1 hypothetical protein [Pseudomonas corrugata]MDU9039318.1 hypothetical protein [Pseudomonas corrugata]QTH15353.1 hypothetical protein C4C32_05470 [Pseudomonas corrugata]
MTTISATTVNPYPLSAPKVRIGGAAEETTATSPASTDAGDEKEQSLKVDTSGANIAGAPAAGGVDTVEQLKKQIEQAEKLLAQQQAELARVQKSQASEEQKIQQAMAIQTQIMGTQAALQSLRASLLQAMAGSVDTHA